MKVYDIIDEQRGVGRGEYAGFVWDQPSGSRNITVRFPDGRTTTVTSREDARRVADDWLSRSRNGSAAGAPTTPAPTTQHPNKFMRIWNRVRPAVGPLGDFFFTVAMWDALRTRTAQIWNEKERGAINQEQYEAAMSAAMGAWVASTSPLVIRTFSRLSRSAISGMVRLLRSWNFITTPALLAIPGAGVGIALLKFVIFEASTWVLGYFVANNETFRNWLMRVIFIRAVANVLELFEVGADYVVNAGNIVSENFVGDESEDARNAPIQQNRARRMIGLDPAERAQQQNRDDEQAARAAAASGGEPSNGSGAAPASNAPAAPSRTPTGNDWMLAPSLR